MCSQQLKLLLSGAFFFWIPACLFEPATPLGPAMVSGQGLAEVDNLLKFGEFPKVEELAANLSPAEKDSLYHRLSTAQGNHGVPRSMWQTASRISDPSTRSKVYQALSEQVRQGSLVEPINQLNPESLPGSRGGITVGDFQPLINLITQTIAPEEWTTTQGEGTIQPYLTGVYVNAAGELKRLEHTNTHRIREYTLPLLGSAEYPISESPLRRLSLKSLEKQVETLTAQGKPIPEELEYLAGIYDLQYLIVDSRLGDLSIAGPAGPWRANADGVRINLSTGRPVLRLCDLVACLRNAWYDGGRFGCAITPREANLALTQEFLRTTQSKGATFRNELQQTVGWQDVEVFGLPPNSPTAQVLVEADYRMKLLGMGLEPSIPQIPSYFQIAQSQAPVSSSMDVARWWFTLNYEGIACNQDRTLFEFTGTGVKVLSETEMLSQLGKRIHTHQAQGPTREFAESFTQHFESISDQYPVYNQLRNIFDLAMVFSLIRNEKLAEKANWYPAFFGRGGEGPNLVYQAPKTHVAQVVHSVMNSDTFVFQKNGKKFRQTLVGVSGGIDCQAQESVKQIPHRVEPLLPNLESRATPIERCWWD